MCLVLNLTMHHEITYANKKVRKVLHGIYARQLIQCGLYLWDIEGFSFPVSYVKLSACVLWLTLLSNNVVADKTCRGVLAPKEAAQTMLGGLKLNA